jgi:hypothetical protein
MTNEKRLEIIKKNILAFSDHLDEINQLGAIDDKAWDYIVAIEQTVGGIWPEDKTEK